MTKQKEILTDSAPMELSPMLVAGVGAAVPILFSSPMVRAIASGRKTMTRRIINLDPEEHGFTQLVIDPELCGTDDDDEIIPVVKKGLWAQFDKGEEHVKCSFGNIGGTLWVRETFYPKTLAEEPPGDRYWYKADYHFKDEMPTKKWKPSIFMPKDACRLRLTIKNIRVERLHEMTEEDAHAEGIEMNNKPHAGWYWMEDVYCTDSPLKAFELLWKKINGEKSWNENPYVWVIQFERAAGCCANTCY